MKISLWINTIFGISQNGRTYLRSLELNKVYLFTLKVCSVVLPKVKRNMDFVQLSISHQLINTPHHDDLISVYICVCVDCWLKKKRVKQNKICSIWCCFIVFYKKSSCNPWNWKPELKWITNFKFSLLILKEFWIVSSSYRKI